MRPHIVHFSLTSRPYKVLVSHCSEIDCPCTFATFEFTAASDELEPGTEGLAGDIPAAFEIDVDASTWREHEPRPGRSAAETAMAREFLRDYPRSERQALKERLEKKQRIARRFLDYRISPGDISITLPWTQLASEYGSVMNGGKSVSFTFDHQGTRYHIEDMYCPHPRCGCQRADLCFFKILPGATPDVPGRGVQFFDASVSLTTGKPQVDKCIGATSEEAASVLAHWWQHDADLLDTLKRRYRKIKEVGLRSLSAASPRRAMQPRRPGASRWVNSDPPEADEFSTPRRLTPVRAAATPGRNDKCPCGSGKKFKKCCGS
jgi:hypothetical protein